MAEEDRIIAHVNTSMPNQSKTMALKDTDTEQKASASHIQDISAQLAYDDGEEEPELHLRTYLALIAMFVLSLAQIVALIGPPTVLSTIGKDLNGTVSQTWIPNSLSLVQTVLAPIISSASDTFQARKAFLVGLPLISCVGAAIAPGASGIARLIGAQIMIAFGYATTPLSYCVTSEIVPKRWRPVAQGFINVAAGIGAAFAPLMIGALTRNNPHTGWRNFYWFQMALWGLAAALIVVAYRPPMRHTRFDDLNLLQKISRLDLPGMAVLAAGLMLLLVGLNLGGNQYSWSSAPVLATLVTGIVLLGVFAAYEWKVTKTGIFHHALFRGGKLGGRTVALCLLLIFIEGLMFFAYVVFYPILTGVLYETDIFLVAARGEPFWIMATLSTMVYGLAASKLRSIKVPLFVGYLILTAGTVGFATLQPNDAINALAFAGVSGFGLGSPLVLLIAGLHLATPHELIATVTAIATSSRAISQGIFTAIYSAAFSSRIDTYLPRYVAAAALGAGLPSTSLDPFIAALASNNATALQAVPAVTTDIIQSGVTALQQAYADSVRVVFIIAAPFGIVACITCFFIGDLRSLMNYQVDAPVEVLHAKNRPDRGPKDGGVDSGV